MPTIPGTKMTCPGCSGTAILDAAGLGYCDRCGGLIGENVLPEVAYRWVRPGFCRCPDTIKQERYYDMVIVGPGVEPHRRHGFYHVECQGITQTG